MLPFLLLLGAVGLVAAGAALNESKCERYRGRQICVWRIDAGRAWGYALDGAGSARGYYASAPDAMTAGRRAVDNRRGRGS